MLSALTFAVTHSPLWLWGVLAAAAACAFGQVVVADSGGAEAAPAADASDGAPDAAASAAVAGDDDDDDPDVDHDDDSDLPEHIRENPRYKQNRTKLRREQRWRAKNRGTVDRVAALGGHEALEALTARARQADTFEQLLEKNPKVRALLHGGSDDTADVTPAKKTPRHIELMDAFDADHPATPVMRRMAETLDRLEDDNKSLRQELAGVTRTTTVEREQKTATEWRQATEAAAATLDPTLREMFSDAVAGAFQHAQRQRLAIKPQQVIDRYLKSVGVSARGQATASAAAAQRIANGNSKLPNRPAQHGRPAAPARSRETVQQVTARLRREGRLR
jgi:hypothetical protein